MLQELLQVLEAFGIFLGALAMLAVLMPLWPLGICAFIEWQRAPFLPDSVVD